MLYYSAVLSLLNCVRYSFGWVGGMLGETRFTTWKKVNWRTCEQNNNSGHGWPKHRSAWAAIMDHSLFFTHCWVFFSPTCSLNCYRGGRTKPCSTFQSHSLSTIFRLKKAKKHIINNDWHNCHQRHPSSPLFQLFSCNRHVCIVKSYLFS